MSILSDPGPEDNKVEETETTNSPLNVASETMNPVPADQDVLPSDASTPGDQSENSVDVETTTTTVQVTEPKSQLEQVEEILRNAIGDIGANSNFKCIFYGPPGSTKSSMLGDIPNNLIVDLEDGLIAAKTAKIYTGRDLAPNVKAYPYKDFEKLDNLVGFLLEGLLKEFKVFSMDSISDLHKRELQAITERSHAVRPSKSLYRPETEEYTEINEKLTRLVRRLRDMPRDIVITAHSQVVTPKNGPSKVYPDFSEKLTNKLLAMMDVVGYMEMREFQLEDGTKTQRPVMRVISDGTIYAKTRIPLPAEIMNPRWVDFKAAWEQARTEGTLSEAESAEALAQELLNS